MFRTKLSMTVSQTDAEKDRKVKALLALADYHWKEFDGNRELEWKANFVLWPALAALTGILTWRDVKLSFGLACWIWLFLVCMFLIYWLFWQTGMWQRNFESTEAARVALERVRVICEEKPLERERAGEEEAREALERLRDMNRKRHEERRRRRYPRWDWWDYWNVIWRWSRGSQLAFTFAFAAMAAATVWYHITPCVPVAQQASKSPAQVLSQPPSQNPAPNTTPSATLSTPNPAPARP